MIGRVECQVLFFLGLENTQSCTCGGARMLQMRMGLITAPLPKLLILKGFFILARNVLRLR